jgi:hypothetical protein
MNGTNKLAVALVIKLLNDQIHGFDHLDKVAVMLVGSQMKKSIFP